MTEGNIHWHPAFCAALQIELEEDSRRLRFEEEYLLGKKPMQIDVVVLKKQRDVKLQKNIGHDCCRKIHGWDLLFDGGCISNAATHNLSVIQRA